MVSPTTGYGETHVAHVDSIKPALVGVDLLVPELPFRRPGMGLQLATQVVGCKLVLLLPGLLVSERERASAVQILG